MMRTAPLMALSIALALAACSKSQDAPQEAAVTDTATNAEDTALVAPGTDGPPPSDASLAPATNSSAVVAEIPEPFRGRWGLVANDCTVRPGEAKGLLTVSATQIRFYESVATLGKVSVADSNRLSGTFHYSGEGQSWTLDVALKLQDGGKSIIWREYGPDAIPGPEKYIRCD